MRQLEADIKNKIYKRAYLLCGPQSYMRNRYEKALVKIFVSENDTMNLTYFYGKKIDLNEVRELAMTMPFMSDRRVIVLENTELFSRSCEELADLIPEIPDETVMIFSEEKVDSRLKQVKAVKSSGCIAEFTTLSDEDLKDWVLGRLGREHRPITSAALDMFLARCSDDLWQVSNDLEKLVSYTFGKDGIRAEDVEAVCMLPARDRIFMMIDAVLDGNTQKALGLYKDLVILRTDPTRILGLIRDQLRLLMHLKTMSSGNMSKKEISDILGMRESRIKMALPASQKSSNIYLEKGIKLCADTEERIKTGLIDEQIGIETLIIDLSALHTLN